MPRGDGDTPKERQELWGKPRPNRKRTNVGTQVSKKLARRQKWWDDFGTAADPNRNKVTGDGPKLKYTNYDGILDYRRPGSQKK